MRAAPDRHHTPVVNPSAPGAIRAVDERGVFEPQPSPASALQQRLLARTAAAEGVTFTEALSARARLGIIVAASSLLWGVVALPFVAIHLIG